MRSTRFIRLAGTLAGLMAFALAGAAPMDAAAHPALLDGAGNPTAAPASSGSLGSLVSTIATDPSRLLASATANCHDIPVPHLPATIVDAGGHTYDLVNGKALQPGRTCVAPFQGKVASALLASTIRIQIPGPRFRGTNPCPTAGNVPCYALQPSAQPASALPPPGCGGPGQSPTTANLNVVKEYLGCIGVQVPDLPDTSTVSGMPAPKTGFTVVPESLTQTYYDWAGRPLSSTTEISYDNVAALGSQTPTAAAPMTTNSASTPSAHNYPCIYNNADPNVAQISGWTLFAKGGNDVNGDPSGFTHKYVIQVYERDSARSVGAPWNGETYQIEMCSTGNATGAGTTSDGQTVARVKRTAVSLTMDFDNLDAGIGDDGTSGDATSQMTTGLEFQLSSQTGAAVNAKVDNVSNGTSLSYGWGMNCAYSDSGWGANRYPSNEVSDCYSTKDACYCEQQSAATGANGLYEFGMDWSGSPAYDASAASVWIDRWGHEYWVNR